MHTPKALGAPNYSWVVAKVACPVAHCLAPRGAACVDRARSDPHWERQALAERLKLAEWNASCREGPAKLANAST